VRRHRAAWIYSCHFWSIKMKKENKLIKVCGGLIGLTLPVLA
jgi:hypothetical protein